MLAVVLSAAAAGVLTMGDRPGVRLAQVLQRAAPPTTPVAGLDPRVRVSSALLAGVAVAGLLGGAVGIVAGPLAALACARLLQRWDGAPDEAAEARAVAEQLPLLLELLAACLAGGATPLAAVDAVSVAADGPASVRLRRVADALRVGCPPGEAWRVLGTVGPAAAAGRALARAADGGAPVAGAVHRVAEDARRDARALAEQRARRAGVLAVGPLGLCFLPAFLLIGVVPTVVGLAGPLLTSLT